MNTNFLHKLFRSITTPPVTPESLASYYANAPDVELQRVDPAELTSVARPLLRAELDKRSNSRRKLDSVA